jgi:carbonic anhydrase/acetyltransferase-like protein (isoleucine patch superfamily)
VISPHNKIINRFLNELPKLGSRVYVDRTASVTGSVFLGDDVSVWPMAVIRGDVNRIAIGIRSNIQDTRWQA